MGSVLTVDAINRLLAAVARWFFSFFIRFASDLAAEALAPVKNPRDPEEDARQPALRRRRQPGLPAVLYSQATSTILDRQPKNLASGTRKTH